MRFDFNKDGKVSKKELIIGLAMGYVLSNLFPFVDILL